MLKTSLPDSTLKLKADFRRLGRTVQNREGETKKTIFIEVKEFRAEQKRTHWLYLKKEKIVSVGAAAMCNMNLCVLHIKNIATLPFRSSDSTT